MFALPGARTSRDSFCPIDGLRSPSAPSAAELVFLRTCINHHVDHRRLRPLDMANAEVSVILTTCSVPLNAATGSYPARRAAERPLDLHLASTTQWAC